MSRTIILVTGANGQLGKELKRLENNYPQYQFLFTGREELQIDDEPAVISFFEKYRPTVCINCAAYTAVDKAELEEKQASRINADAVRILASACRDLNTRLIHISTDYVFDGDSSIPYKETDSPHPMNVYGRTKLLGELMVKQLHPGSIIIRTSWVYSEFGNNFVKTMMRLMKERESINVVNDQIGSPTYAADLAEAIMQIVFSMLSDSAINEPLPTANGIYHYSNEGAISWFDFAVAIKDITGSPCKVNPIPSSQFPTPAKRPKFSLLDKSKIRSVFNLYIPDWRVSLQKCISRM